MAKGCMYCGKPTINDSGMDEWENCVCIECATFARKYHTTP